MSMMMEQLDLEQLSAPPRFRVFETPDRHPGEASKSACGKRLITLRRYSPVICLIELLTIALFVYLLLWRTPTGDRSLSQCHKQIDTPASPQSSARTYAWPNETQHGAMNVLQLDLIQNCNQRKHDYLMGVECSSRQAQACGSVETKKLPADAAGLKSDEKLATIIVTSKNGDRLAKSTVALKRVNCKSICPFKTRVKVNRAATKQKIIGWGGALTDSSINNLLSLTINGTRQLLRDYFGPDGLMFNMVRITIGGSDFSSRFYTNDDDLNAQTDLELANFKLREEDILYKIPVLKLIQQEFQQQDWLLKRNRGGLKLFASMWSPPVWMKTNRHFNKGQLRGRIDDEPLVDPKQPPQSELYFNSLAELKVQFIRSYQQEGIDFWGLTVMNEPLFSVQPFLDFNTMIFPSDDYANYVAKYLGPKIKGNPKLKHIKLMAHDDNRRFLESFTWPIMEQKRVRQYLDGISVHGYADEAYHLMDKTYAKYRNDQEEDASVAAADADFFVLPTELCSGHLPFMAKALIGNWHRGVHYALDIIRSLQNAAAGWVDWNMALDLEGGPGWLGGRLDAPVIVDKARDVYHKSPMFYVLGQFSRYIPPGSVKLDSHVENVQFDHQFETVSFLLSKQQEKEEEKVATVILNNNPYPIDLHLRVYSRQPTSDLETFYIVPCPADSIQTVIYTPDRGDLPQ